MTKNKNKFEIIIGSFVLITAVIFLLSSMKTAKINNDNDGYKLTAKFSNITGINNGSDVKIAGVKIGQVVDQALDKVNYQAILTFKINQDIKIPSDSSIKIASEGLLGGKHLAIEIGSDEEFLKENDEISFTQSSINLEDLLGRFIFNSENKKEADKVTNK